MAIRSFSVQEKSYNDCISLFDKVATYVVYATTVSTLTSTTVDTTLLLWKVFCIVRVDVAGDVTITTVVLNFVNVEVSVTVDVHVGRLLASKVNEAQYAVGFEMCCARVDISASQSTHCDCLASMMRVKADSIINNALKRGLYNMILEKML